MKMSWDTAWMLARPVVVALLLVILLLRMFEDRMIFFPFGPETGSWDTSAMGLETEDVFLTTEDGVKIHSWWASAPQLAPPAAGNAVPDPAETGSPEKAVPTILYFHGNAGNLADRVDNILFLTELPANVLAVDYRRYGKSEGPFPTEEGVYRDARAAYDYLVTERGIDPARLVVLGQSLGTTVAVNLAAEREVAGLILEAGFPSAPRFAQRSMPLPGLRFIMRSRFDSASKLKRITRPVLVAHCANDLVIPFDLGEELFEAANQPKTFVGYDATCHEPLYVAASEDYRERLREFLAEAVPEH